MKIKKGDTVLVIKGRERGKTGKVASVNVVAQTVKISGINVAKKHMKPRGQKVSGGITEIVKPLPTAKIMFLCSHCNKPTRLGSQLTSAGNRERICKICKSTV
ncbi:MAG: 50S ribosomal protein L24 [Patescibacteria group bacterium]|jgi:large subunit ribosomal protein L24